MKTKTLPFRRSTTCLPYRLAFLLVALVLACFATLPEVRAVDPPPDGGYPNENTAEGEDALFHLDMLQGLENTAIGFQALYNNTTGYENTAVGDQALHGNTSGAANTALGVWALAGNTTGNTNVAIGHFALVANTTGEANVAIGWEAGEFFTTGYGNVAIGPLVGGGGDENVAIGDRAMGNTNEGSFNTAVGYGALSYCTGSYNIGVGQVGGAKLTTGSHNIDIGSEGETGDNRTIRIGNPKTQRKAYLAAVNDVTLADGVPVIINKTGQLGIVTSSARYKEAIKPMDKASKALLALQPVTFRYKNELDPNGIPQFGLVAEDVAKVNPDLVARDEQGKPYTVRYEAVNAMLLNEFLKEHRKVQELAALVTKGEATAAKQQAAITEQRKQIQALTAGLQKVSAQLELNKAAPQTVVNNR